MMVLLLPLLFLLACADSADHDIAKLIEGGATAESAYLSLRMSGPESIGALIDAFQDTSNPLTSRIQLLEVLEHIHQITPDEHILVTLVGAVRDADSQIRDTAVKSLGNIGQRAFIEPLVARLEVEDDEQVRVGILEAMELLMGERDLRFRESLGTARMTDSQRERFTRALLAMRREALSNTLVVMTREWLEIRVWEIVSEADNHLLKADLKSAETRMRNALELLPDSKFGNFRLGRFHLDYGDRDQALDYLHRAGMIVRARRMSERPVIDGSLQEAAWADAEPVTNFYRMLGRRAPYPSTARTEAYAGYVENTLYLAFVGFEESTADLNARCSEHDDGNIWMDDSMQWHIDTNRDYRSYFGFIINSIGTLLDTHCGGNPHGDGTCARDWTAPIESAVKVEDDSWTAEIGIGVEKFDPDQIRPGDAWGLQLCRNRPIADEIADWAPTHENPGDASRYGILVFE